jgi:small subunit ribosomal protein S20
MANIKSAKKSIKTDAKKTIANTAVRSKVKNSIKRCEAAIKSGDKEVANKELKTVVANIDKACSKGLVKKNTCARQKSRLNKKVKEMNA